MRIAHVSATFPPYQGGTGNVCFYNAVELARRGHDVTVFTAAYPPGEYQYPPGINVRRLPITFRVGNAPLLPGLLAIKNFDLIHLHYPFIFGSEIVTFISKVRKIPLIFTYHNDLIGDKGRKHLFRLYSAISAPVVFSSSRKLAVLSLDHAGSSQLHNLFQKRTKDVIEVPNGVDPILFSPGPCDPSIRSGWHVAEDAKVVLFVGALDRAHHFKGVDTLIQAFSRIDDPDTFFVIVGDGDMKAHYQETARNVGISSKTIFLGNISNDQMPPVYRAVDLVVLPSLQPESFGLVLVEAMACGRPVIASNIPGVRSVISNGRDGFLTEPGNIEDLAQKMKTLLSNEGLRRTMGQNGNRKVLENYTWPRVVDRLEAVYSSIIKKS